MPPESSWKQWYKKLKKPSWTPSGKTIGIIWSVLYPMIAVSYVYVLINYFRGNLDPIIFGIFTVNLGANIAFSPVFFGLKNIPLATLDILIVWITILLQHILIWQHSWIIGVLQIPYFIWVSIASVVQLTVYSKNKK